MLASLFLWNEHIFTGIFLYIFVVLLDHVDGTVARVNGEATFYGRFIDGFFGIILNTLIKISVTGLILNEFGFNATVWLGIAATVLTPMHYLFYDRYSSFSRWINEQYPDKKYNSLFKNKYWNI